MNAAKPLVAAIRLCVRGPLIALYLLIGLLAGSFVRWLSGPQRHRLTKTTAMVRWWRRLLPRLLGIRLRTRGTRSVGPALLASNHVSWLDIIVLRGIHPDATFVSKDTVRSWPIIGPLAEQAGTLFLERDSRSAVGGTVREMTDILTAGEPVVMFPEGTTTEGDTVQPFHAALFQAAIRARVPLQPVALQYVRHGRRDKLVPFVGDDALVPHLVRLIGAGPCAVTVSYAETIVTEGGHRKDLALKAHRAVLGLINPSVEQAAA